jgi:hypothetical protein
MIGRFADSGHHFLVSSFYLVIYTNVKLRFSCYIYYLLSPCMCRLKWYGNMPPMIEFWSLV